MHDWEPIINEDIFKSVGEILKKNKSRKTSSPQRWPYLLSGMLHCQCGHRMSGKSTHGNGGKIAYYDHAWTAKIESVTDQKSKRCDPQRVLAEKLEPIVWKAVKDFLLVPEFFTEILLEAQTQSELQTPKQDIERKQNKIYEINMQLDALSERLGLLPKSVNPKHVFDQMERLSVQKDGLEKEVVELKRNNERENVAVGMADFNQFKAVIVDLLENENDPVVKAAIIQKMVHKIVVKNDEFEIFIYVGEKYYKRELAIAGSKALPAAMGGNGLNKNAASEKRHTSALPVFHGNKKTSEILTLKPNFFYDAGSNSLKIGRDLLRTCNLTQVHDFIEIQVHLISQENPEMKVLYEQGYSIREIGNQLNVGFATVQRQLVKQQVTLRANKSVKFLENQRHTFKNSAPPPYGFCYLEGRLQKDPREYPILQIIEKQRQVGRSPTEIARYLDGRGFRTRLGKVWKQSHVFNIVKRIKIRAINNKITQEHAP